MSKCANCGRTLGCLCQRRIAKDGNECCKYCITEYNQKLLRNGSGNRRI